MTKNNLIDESNTESCCTGESAGTEEVAPLYETDSYCVRVGASLDFDGPTPGRKLYQIVNKDTLVVEREEFALPFAMTAANSLEEALVEHLNPPSDNVSAIVSH